MSDIQVMTLDMLEILKNFIEIYSFFNEKLEEIKADELLNINLELLKASITDLNINISNFKSNIQNNDVQTSSSSRNIEKEAKKETNKKNVKKENQTSSNQNQNTNSLDNFKELDKKNLAAMFFMYLMQIDKDSILNKSVSSTSPNSNLANQSSISSISSVSSVSNSITNKQIYDDLELD